MSFAVVVNVFVRFFSCEPCFASVKLIAAHSPALKSLYLDQWDENKRLLAAGQSCNWPYSNEACLAYDRDRNMVTLSRAFLEHVRSLNNYSIGRDMFEWAPILKGQVRMLGEATPASS